MERDTIIFSGGSHTLGLGLEWELDPELNSEDYLQKGINIPISRPPHYQKYWKEYRWSTLVCNELGYKQFNIHDTENKIKIGGNSVETIWMMFRDEEKIKELLEKTKYIVLEVGYIRWYEEELHGGEEGHKYPNTIQEMIDLINNPKSDIGIVSKTLQWIHSTDPELYMLELYNKINHFKINYPKIEFVIIPWHSSKDSIEVSKSLKNNILKIVENDIKYKDMYDFQLKNKIHVWNKAKAFNDNYEYNYREDHGSIEGHQRTAQMVINHIKKLENE